MQVGEDALATCFLEMPVLQEAHNRLEDDDGADDEQADDWVGLHGVLEVAQIVTDSDPESHAADHHDEAYHLDRDMNRRDLIPQISIL